MELSMTTTQSGEVLASGDDGRSSPGESKAAAQPPITPGAGLISTGWLPGPCDSTQSRVVVSFTDFHAESEQDWQQIAELGMKLAESWPIMHGAVGLWLWGKPSECAADRCPCGTPEPTYAASSVGLCTPKS
ncbi:hypothetical protein ACKUT9_12745 [Mycobacterium seoulense]|uniref:hypothetical protein n=1 Tax=Mycobacterium seoulense TaxID=386911 RepID=UPI003CF2C30C